MGSDRGKGFIEMQDWDAIVVGSGMGGMTAAAYLAGAGRRTLVLEQGDVLGGCTHVFRREGYEFEVGATRWRRQVWMPSSVGLLRTEFGPITRTGPRFVLVTHRRL
ncbi:NAD(P)-binding protein, partial [Nocardia sp. KC 131]|uniref:NAD(P)-binding protein n=1 Tax=Nocardia arseniciresistens TaxID=3392119 RepID=UPI00398F6BE6